jgi:hypothetical protein
MRLLVLLASGAAVSLAGCDRNNQAQGNEAVEDSLTANSIVANDITAIDAVTADAANMAADVDINFTNDQVLYNGSGSTPRAAPPETAGGRPSARPAPGADNATD